MSIFPFDATVRIARQQYSGRSGGRVERVVGVEEQATVLFSEDGLREQVFPKIAHVAREGRDGLYATERAAANEKTIREVKPASVGVWAVEEERSLVVFGTGAAIAIAQTRRNFERVNAYYGVDQQHVREERLDIRRIGLRQPWGRNATHDPD